ncbi:hypothetical protein DL769_000227 [Monosporascus sp. CRB-8-3]|nr:hypothetical protein DL769_000227 [Monosporascus sp. CRB-8-3]
MSTEKWKNPQLTSDMMMALYTVLGPIPGEKKDELVKFMQDRGHDVTWEGIRTTPIQFLDFFNIVEIPEHHRPQPIIHHSQYSISHSTPSILIMTKKWDDQMLAQLGQIIFDVVQPQFNQEHQDAIVQRMNEKGYTVNWNAIRQTGSMKWAPEVDGDILLAFRDALTLTSADWINIVESLNKMGHNVTCGSLKQHLQKLKRAQEKEGGSGSAPSTPTKKTRAPGKKGTTSASKRKSGPVNLDNLSDDNEEDTPVQTPSRKKQKTTAQPANAGQLPGDEPLPPVVSGKKAKKEEPAAAASGYDEPVPPFLPSSQPEWEV